MEFVLIEWTSGVIPTRIKTADHLFLLYTEFLFTKEKKVWN